MVKYRPPLFYWRNSPCATRATACLQRQARGLEWASSRKPVSKGQVMEKSHLFGNRGLRRWESRKKWFRRLRSDWNDHWEGWSPEYDWKDGVMCYIGPGDPTRLCDCFNLTTWAALRFKDTPRSCSCLGCGGNPRRLLSGRMRGREGELTLAELAVNIGDREFWSKRKYREGYHPYRVKCLRCGYLLKIVKVKNGGHFSRTDRQGLRCPGCDKEPK
jgi:hypothetical protein